MRSARERSVLAMLVVVALIALLAVPALAFADETQAPGEVTATDPAPAEEVAAVEVTAPAEQADPALETAPAGEAPAEGAPAAAEEVAAPQASAALTRPLLTLRSRAGKRFATQQRASSESSAASKARTRKATKLVAATPVACSDEPLLSQWSLLPTRTFNPGTNTTTFTWVLTYTPTADASDGDEKCALEGISNITITVCVAALSSSPTAELMRGTTYSYKWESNPKAGDSFSLIYAGDIAGGGSAVPVYKKSGTLTGTASSGPSCSIAGTCTSWSLDVDISNTGIGTGTVGDNHGNSTSTDTTWTYNATQMAGTVDLLAAGTNGSTATNGGQNDVAFTAHPGCNARYSLTFDKAQPCTTWTLDVAVTNTGIGTGTVSDNHGHSTSSSTTWTYTAAQMGDVDITAAETGGSTASNAGQSDIVFSAHPNCDADYSVTFDKVDLACTTWTLDVDVTNSGIGTGTVSDNHGNSTSVDTTWVYNSTQIADVDITSVATNGSSFSNSGASNVAFSAHPNCNADYSVTFTKTQVQNDCSGDTDPTNNGPNGDCTIPPVPDCSGDFDPTNNGPNGDCTIPPTPDCSGDFDPTNNGPNGDCTIPPTPDCSGDSDPTNNGPNGDCVEVTDVCPNIEGDQAQVPDDMVINPETGNCEEDEVLGEIIDKDKDKAKAEPSVKVAPQKVAPAVLPSKVQAGALPFTGFDLPPFLMIAGLLMTLGAGLTMRHPARTTK